MELRFAEHVQPEKDREHEGVWLGRRRQRTFRAKNLQYIQR
jgi:hypothetical protein